MDLLRALFITGIRLFRYELYRFGIGPRPTLRDIYHELKAIFSFSLGWERKLRIRGEEHCPKHGPAIFVANHLRVDDPLVMSRNIYHASEGGIQTWFMMRNDFFQHPLVKNFFYDLDELTAMIGGIGISRDGVRLSQMRPFVDLLKNKETFVIYPMGTRTRTGAVLEHRPGDTGPGSAAFFAAQALGRSDADPIPIVPVVRTLDITDDSSVTVFGPPDLAIPGMSREARARMDDAVLARMGELVEVNMAHVAAGLIYLRALHGLDDHMPVDQLKAQAAAVLRRLDAKVLIGPRAVSNPHRELVRVLDYFQDKGFVTRSESILVINRKRVLLCPAYTTKYRHENPVRYCVNQVLHLRDFVSAVETESLGETSLQTQ